MPDESTAGTVQPATIDTPAPQPSPAPEPAKAPFDVDAFKADIDKSVKDSLHAGLRELHDRARGAQPTQPAQPVQPTQPNAPDPMEQLIAPYVTPALTRVALTAEAAMDAATFYADPSNAKALKYRDKIEEKFLEMAGSGRPVPRRDVWNWLRGGPLYQTILEDEIKDRDAQLEAARHAQTAGAGSPRVPAAGSRKSAWEMDDNELRDTLKDVAF